VSLNFFEMDQGQDNHLIIENRHWKNEINNIKIEFVWKCIWMEFDYLFH
jgi:hypothetical protein